jgi:hypothetical protein
MIMTLRLEWWLHLTATVMYIKLRIPCLRSVVWRTDEVPNRYSIIIPLVFSYVS